jgi:hypothetical protein
LYYFFGDFSTRFIRCHEIAAAEIKKKKKKGGDAVRRPCPVKISVSGP